MSQNNENCKGTTKTGEQCQLKPGPSGYCHLHDPQKIAAEKLAQEEAERQMKAARDEEIRHRSQQLQEVTDVITALEENLQQYRENSRQYRLLKSVVEGLYVEIDKLTKKAPAELITELALEQINDVIKDTKILMKDDPYIQKLKEFIPAGDMPQLRDTLIVLGQVKQGLGRVSGVWDTKIIASKLEEACVIKLVIEYALEGEDKFSILQRLKNDKNVNYHKFPEEWEIKGAYNQDSAFNLKLLDTIDIQGYFIGQ